MNEHMAYIRLRTTPVPATKHDEPELTVGELMTPEAITVSEDMLVADCARLMDENEISGLPVVDTGGALVGMISESDVVRARATEYLWARWPGLRVRHLMHAPVLTANRQMAMEEAAQIMESAHIHRLVVVDDNQVTPIGVISTSDLVRALAHRATDG